MTCCVKDFKNCQGKQSKFVNFSGGFIFLFAPCSLDSSSHSQLNSTLNSPLMAPSLHSDKQTSEPFLNGASLLLSHPYVSLSNSLHTSLFQKIWLARVQCLPIHTLFISSHKTQNFYSYLYCNVISLLPQIKTMKIGWTWMNDDMLNI